MTTTYERVDIVSMVNGTQDEFDELKQDRDKILVECKNVTKEERKLLISDLGMIALIFGYIIVKNYLGLHIDTNTESIAVSIPCIAFATLGFKCGRHLNNFEKHVKEFNTAADRYIAHATIERKIFQVPVNRLRLN